MIALLRGTSSGRYLWRRGSAFSAFETLELTGLQGVRDEASSAYIAL
jgi:hypothetical protein